MGEKDRETSDAKDAEDPHRTSLMMLLHEMVRKEGWRPIEDRTS